MAPISRASLMGTLTHRVHRNPFAVRWAFGGCTVALVAKVCPCLSPPAFWLEVIGRGRTGRRAPLRFWVPRLLRHWWVFRAGCRSRQLRVYGGRVVDWIRPGWTSRRSFDPLGPVVLFWVHCCWGSKPACSNRLQVSGRMLLRPSSPAGVSRNELHFSLSASFRLCGASCVVGLVVCGSRAAGRLPGIWPSNPAAAYIAGIAKPVFEPFSLP